MNDIQKRLRGPDLWWNGLYLRAAMSALEHFFEILAVARRGGLSGRDYSLIVIGAVLALAETGSEDNFESLHEAASRATKHIFQDRVHRVGAPSSQAASQRRKGITTTQEDDD
jgi:hypothetical protein